MSEPIIEVKDLWHIYPGRPPVTAIKGVTLDIYEGEILAIIGQNGSGKTTLVKHFNALLKPTKGTVKVFGADTTTADPSELCQKVGYVFQNPDHMLFSGTIEEEVSFGPKTIGLPKDAVEKRTRKALEMLRIYEIKERYPRLLPLIGRVRTAIASVLALDPEVIIFDEPTTGQDHLGSTEILGLAKKLNEEGKTVIFITHDMDLVAQHARRVIVLSQGEILLEGTPEYVFGKPDILARTYLEPPYIARLSQMLEKIDFAKTPLTVDELHSGMRRFITRRNV